MRRHGCALTPKGLEIARLAHETTPLSTNRAMRVDFRGVVVATAVDGECEVRQLWDQPAS